MEVNFARDAAELTLKHGELNGNNAGGRVATPSEPPPAAGAGVVRGVWGALLVRAGGGALLLLVLAGIGSAATRAEQRGELLSLRAQVTPTASSAPSASTPAVAPAPGAAAASTAVAAPNVDARGGDVGPAASAQSGEVTSAPAANADHAGCDQSSADCQPGKAASGITADGKVILNLANAEELQRLPGVGAVRAEAILALRARLKKFRRPNELLQVRGIGPRGLQRLLPHMVVDAPEPVADPKPTPPGPAG